MDEHEPVSGSAAASAVVEPPAAQGGTTSSDDVVIDLRDPVVVPPDERLGAPRPDEAAADDVAAVDDVRPAPDRHDAVAQAVLDALDEDLQALAVPVVAELPAWPVAPVPSAGAVIEAAAVEVPVPEAARADASVDIDVVVAPEGVDAPTTDEVDVDDEPVIDDEPAALPVPAAAALPAAWVGGAPSWIGEPVGRWRTAHLVGAAVCTLLLGLAFGALVGRTSAPGSPAAVRPVVRTTGSSGTTGGAGASGAAATAPAGTPRLSLADAASVALTGPGSFREPYPIGARPTLRDAVRGDLDIVVIGVDADPWPELKAANAFNTPPPSNLRYVMATVAVVFHAGTETRTFDGVSGALVLSAFGSAGREHRDAEYPVLAPQPLDRAADLLDGGSVYGNVVFAVEADSRAVTLRVQRTSCTSPCGEVWFTLS